MTCRLTKFSSTGVLVYSLRFGADFLIKIIYGSRMRVPG